MTSLPSPYTVKTDIDLFLHDYLNQRVVEAESLGERYVHMWQRIRDVSLAGGKRLRPYLTVVGYGALDEKIIPIAAAQELVHIAMLMHDDIIDEDFVRHGVLNMSGLYRKEYAAHIDKAEAKRHANSMAIIAGDALISEAHLLIANSTFEPQVKQALQKRLGQSIFEVIGGELLDVEASFLYAVRQYDPEVIYRYKTASYSFIGPLISGAIAGCVSQEQQRLLFEYGESLGIAYQIQDDILGVFGDESVTGKTTVGDLQEGKRTILVANHEKRMDDAMRQRFSSFGSPDADDVSLRGLKQDIEDSGALRETDQLARTHFEKARESVIAVELDAQRSALGLLLGTLQERKM